MYVFLTFLLRWFFQQKKKKKIHSSKIESEVGCLSVRISISGRDDFFGDSFEEIEVNNNVESIKVTNFYTFHYKPQIYVAGYAKARRKICQLVRTDTVLLITSVLVVK